MPSSSHPLRLLSQTDCTRLVSNLAPYTVSCSLDPSNVHQNRYRDVLPYDHSLLAGPYLNASYLSPFPSNAAPSNLLPSFIASQAPLPSTFPNFYHHLLEQDVDVLVNLTPETQGGRRKADRYYPTTNQDIQMEGWDVTCENEERKGQVVLRTLLLRRKDQHKMGKKIRQIHLTHWPDHGVLHPKDTENLVTLILDQVAASSTDRDSHTDHTASLPSRPIWIHCSAGIGRTGTVIACFTAQRLLETSNSAAARGAAGKEEEDLPSRLVAWMRHSRPGMVQTEEQYDAIVAYVEKLKEEGR